MFRELKLVAGLVAFVYESDGLMRLVAPPGNRLRLRMCPLAEPGKFVLSLP